MSDYSNFESKWTPEVADKGYTQIPNCLITCQSILGLTSIEVLTLVHLLQYQWTKERLPYPSAKTLAKRMGKKSDSSIRKNLASLEKKGFIKRIYRTGTTNQFDTSPTIGHLDGHYCQIRGKNIELGVTKNKPPLSEIISTKEDAIQGTQIIDQYIETNSEIGIDSDVAVIQSQKRQGGAHYGWYESFIGGLAEDMSINRNRRHR